MKKLIIAPVLLALLAGCSKTETTSTQSSAGTDRYGTNRYSAASLPATNEAQTSREIVRNQPAIPPAQKEQLSRPIEGQTPKASEAGLGQQVQSALMADDNLKSAAANVQATALADGTVTLKGSVASEKEKSAIEAKVKEMSGVKKVDNQLEIRSAQPEKTTDQEKPAPEYKNP